ncbi:MAG: rod shape-determining protein MreC [Deltaproteobacteria bacterium HGW-Deltaproteobacteria-1]|jgi:rod shape-determining protein MreC|nr:MAG: rod shape-determining protein MreC [Deltaproteobacteria bacterium HGW-Deltaproteobacteria-1]
MFLKNYRTVILAGAIIAAALILLSYNLRYDTGAGVLKNMILEAATPFQKVFNASVAGVENAWKRYIHLVGLEEDNRKLKSKITALQEELILYKEGNLEAQRLKKLLSLQDAYGHRFIAARVIGKELSVVSKTLWIDKGKTHGLKPGMPVLVSPGLIGRLTDVSWHSSKVLLLIDENSNVDVLIQRTRVQGIARGAGTLGCVLRYVSKIQDVKEGDVVVTAGFSNIFPKGLLVGKVSYVNRMGTGLFLKIHVAPFADLSSVEEVMVLAAEQQESDQRKMKEE